jgi:hypothetical protein
VFYPLIFNFNFLIFFLLKEFSKFGHYQNFLCHYLIILIQTNNFYREPHLNYNYFHLNFLYNYLIILIHFNFNQCFQNLK